MVKKYKIYDGLNQKKCNFALKKLTINDFYGCFQPNKG
jgi:hypothetical protein